MWRPLNHGIMHRPVAQRIIMCAYSAAATAAHRSTDKCCSALTCTVSYQSIALPCCSMERIKLHAAPFPNGTVEVDPAVHAQCSIMARHFMLIRCSLHAMLLLTC
uniref:Uncharacterized protein n=1 Tax=Arundo donax TaxID=35708 RepID=A0A0A9HKF0_ARUDO